MESLSFGALLLLLLQAPRSFAEPTVTSSTMSSTSTTSTMHAASSQAGYGYSSSGSSSSGNGVDVEGGASGPNNTTFSLSTGGLIAVIVVVILVVIFGVVSVVLYVMAKRRNWKIRESIKRASRRLTGRRYVPERSEVDRRKRSGVIAGSRKTGTPHAHPPARKPGVAVEVVDEEKGSSGSDGPTKTSEKRWVQRLWGNDWK